MVILDDFGGFDDAFGASDGDLMHLKVILGI